jgi:hypothetical protein
MLIFFKKEDKDWGMSDITLSLDLKLSRQSTDTSGSGATGSTDLEKTDVVSLF